MTATPERGPLLSMAETQAAILKRLEESRRTELDDYELRLGSRFEVEAVLRALRTAVSESEHRSDFAAWLIEAKHNGITLWWTGGNTAWMTFNEPHWTRDAFQAAHFSNKEAAVRAVALWPEWFRPHVIVTDHLFFSNAPSASAQICPYCTSDNEAIRGTYYDQTCEGCVKRMGR